MSRAGWFQHSYEHSLARRGITTQKYRQHFPKLVKRFPGQNPRLTSKYARFRQQSPASFVTGTFRTKQVSPTTSLILAKQKRDKKFEVQSVMIDRDKYYAEKMWKLAPKDLWNDVDGKGTKGVVFVNKDTGLYVYPDDAHYVEFATEHIDEQLRKGKRKGYMSGKDAGVVQHAHKIVRELRTNATRISVAGSIRRHVPEADINDLDVVAVPKDALARDRMQEYLRAHATQVYQDGDQKFSGKIDGIKTEVIFSKPGEYGSQLLIATGSAGHNIGLARVAQRKGLKLNAHGVFKGKKLIASESEQQIYAALGRPRFKQPNERI